MKKRNIKYKLFISFSLLSILLVIFSTSVFALSLTWSTTDGGDANIKPDYPVTVGTGAAQLVINGTQSVSSGQTIATESGDIDSANNQVLFRYTPVSPAIGSYIEYTLTFSKPVGSLNFSIFDIDGQSGQWHEQVTVNGYLNGTLVNLNSGNFSLGSNVSYVSGNTVQSNLVGDLSSTDTSGRAIVTFPSPVNEVRIRNTNGPSGGTQRMTLYILQGISWTEIPNLTVTKTTTTSNIYAGGQATYNITVTNTGTATANGVTITDTPQSSGFTYDSTGTITLSGSATRPTTSNPTFGANPMTWGNFTIPVGGSVTIPVTMNVATSVPIGTYNNSASTSTSTSGAVITNYNGTSSTGENVNVAHLTPFSNCPTEGLITGSGQLYYVDVTNGNLSTIGSVYTPLYNAMGYNDNDDFIYAHKNSTTDFPLVKIDSNGNVSELGIVSGVTTGTDYFAGDVDNLTNEYIAVPSSGTTKLHFIDINSSSPTYKQNLRTVNLSPSTSMVLTDIAINPVAIGGVNYIYATVGQDIVKINPSTGAWTSFTGVLPTGNYGSIFASSSGNLYTYRNGSRELYAIIMNANQTEIVAVNMTPTTGPAISQTDGARCSNAPGIFNNDISISKTGSSSVFLGNTVTYTLEAVNNGPLEFFDTVISDTVPASITNVSWTCTASGSSSCGSVTSGTGNNISLTTGIFKKDSANKITITVTGTASTIGSITNTATITSPSWVTDTVPTNNTSSQNTLIRAYDYGDAPDSYGTLDISTGAKHINTGSANLFLGTNATDFETNGTPGTNADGDDSTTSPSIDDEDSVSSFPSLSTSSTSYSLSVRVTNNTGNPANLRGWIDFNRNNAFDSGESVTTASPIPTGTTGGTATLNWTGLSGLVAGQSYVRLRFTTDALADTEPTGSKSNGEVEDYPITINTVSTYSISGTIFEDINYGGGAGRSLTTSSGVVRPNATVELYSVASGTATYVTSTPTNVSGVYTFSGLTSGNYLVRVVNQTVTSSRTGSNGTERAVQTFRTNASSGTPIDVTDYVGGQDPTLVDPNTASSGATLNSTTGVFTAGLTGTAQSITNVALGTSNITNINFGYNFDTIVNKNNNGQGSLRQFILNSNLLGGEASLSQSGSRLSNANVSESLPSGKETSIFMISNGLAHSGLRAGITNQLETSGANINSALISLSSSLTTVTASNTIIDGTTQTINVGNTNSGSLNTSTVAGLGADFLEATGDEPIVPAIPKPEISINFGNSQWTISGSDSGLRGFSFYNGLGGLFYTITISGGSGNFVNLLAIGTPSDGSDPTTERNGYGSFRNISSATTFDSNYFAHTFYGLVTTGAPIVTFTNNYMADCGSNKGKSVAQSDADYISVQGSMNITNNIFRNFSYSGQLPDASGGTFLEIISSGVIVDNNTFDSSGTNAIRTQGDNTSVTKNIIKSSLGLNQTPRPGAGIIVLSKNNLISKNSFYLNSGLGIDISGNNVTANNGTINSSSPNYNLDYPIFTSALLTAPNNLSVQGYIGNAPNNTTFANMQIEIYKVNDDSNNNGEIISGDTLSVPHGEGQTYIGTLTSDANGNFSGNLTTTLLTTNDRITAITIDSLNNTSEFSPNISLLYQISGTVFRDLNRDGILDIGETGIENVSVTLINSSNVCTTVLTNSSGQYSFSDLANGTYTVLENGENSASCPPLARPVVNMGGTTALKTTVTINNASVPNINFGNIALSSLVPFAETCPVDGFISEQINNTKFNTVDLYTNQKDQVGPIASFEYNAMGFNTAHRFIYGIRINNTTGVSTELIKVSSNGYALSLGEVSGLPQGIYGSGDYNPFNDRFYVQANNTNTIYSINVDTRTVDTPRNITLSGTYSLVDFVFNPTPSTADNTHYIFATPQAPSSNIFKINTTTGNVATIAVAGLPNSTYIAGFADPENNIYVEDTQTNLYKITLDSTQTSGIVTQIINNNVALSRADGARCPFSRVGTNLRFEPNNTGNGSPGDVLYYPHQIFSKIDGTINLTYTSNQGWVYTLFKDVNGNSLLDNGDLPLTNGDLGNVYNEPGHLAKIIVKVFIPSNAPQGTVDVANITATLTPTNAFIQPSSLSVSDVTTVSSNSHILQLLKSVDKATAKPGENITYTITYTNTGSTSLNSIKIEDMVPANTTFVSASFGSGSSGTITNPSVGGTGKITWDISGSLAPSSSGSVIFVVQIKP